MHLSEFICGTDALCASMLVLHAYFTHTKPSILYSLQPNTSRKKEPYLVLVEGVKGGKSGIKIMSEKEN